MTFGIHDYIKMLRKRGPRLPLAYFIENHWFDLRNGTDTHKWLPKQKFTERPAHYEHGVLYMASWTSVIKSTTRFTLDRFNIDPNDCQFVDIGCGKGKVLCVWHQLFRGSRAELVGIDYSASLINICKQNLDKLSAKNITLIHGDATTISLENEKSYRIIYMYNPFNDYILKKVLPQFDLPNTFIIYNNPLHLSLFFDLGFNLVEHSKGWHPNKHIAILKSSSTLQD